MKRSHILIRNSLYNFISQTWFIIINLLAMPYIVHKLGADSYGILAIVTTFIGYFGFLNLGIGTAIQKYVSEYYAKRNFDLIRRTLSVALVVYGVMGIVGASIISFSTSLLVFKVLKIPSSLHNVAEFAFYASAIGLLLNMPLSVFVSIPKALQRFDIVNKLGIFIGTLQTVFTVLLLFLGYSLKEIVVLNVLINLINFSLLMHISKKLLPALVLKPSFSLNLFIKLFKYSGFISLSQLTSTLAVQFDKLVIGMFLPISLLTYYVVPYFLSQKLWLIPKNIVPVMLPAVSELNSIGEKKLIRNLFFRSTKYISVLVIPLFVIFIVFAKELLFYWMGPEFAEKSTVTLQILTFAFFISTLGWTSVVLAQGMNRPDIPALIQLGEAIVNVLLCFILVPKIGMVGAALALCLNQIIALPLTIYFVIKIVDEVSIRDLIKHSFLKPCLIGFFVAFGCFIIKSFINNLLSMVLLVLLAILIYLLLAYFFILDYQDKNMIFGFVLNNKKLKWLSLTRYFLFLKKE